MEEPNLESFRLETIGELHALATHLFVPFAVARLREYSEATETVFTIELRYILGIPTQEQMLRLYWDKESVSPLPLALGDNVITEWAALGVACAIIWHYGGIRLHPVAVEGDRFDYWGMQGVQELGLEISGTTSPGVESRHREKVQQLRDNPYRSDGYVVVVGFATRRVIFSFHRCDGGSS